MKSELREAVLQILKEEFGIHKDKEGVINIADKAVMVERVNELFSVDQYPWTGLKIDAAVKTLTFDTIQRTIDFVNEEKTIAIYPKDKRFTRGLGTVQEQINRLAADIARQQLSFNDCISIMERPKINIDCDHSWKNYQGFNESYDFCEKCDIKK